MNGRKPQPSKSMSTKWARFGINVNRINEELWGIKSTINLEFKAVVFSTTFFFALYSSPFFLLSKKYVLGKPYEFYIK